jgi:hypothetical protein
LKPFSQAETNAVLASFGSIGLASLCMFYRPLNGGGEKICNVKW